VPVVRVCRRPVAMLGTAMPEAAVEEHRHSRAWKDHICTTANARAGWRDPLSKPEAPAVEGRPQCDLRLRVPAAIAPHHRPDSRRRWCRGRRKPRRSRAHATCGSPASANALRSPA
jgi:hypothetical protein